jgi:hypothetical protein
MDFSDIWSGPVSPDTSGAAVYSADWIDVGASTPPPTAQPSFNSPATQDSFSILNSVSTGVDAVSSSASSIFGTISGLVTSVQTKAAAANANNQAAQLSAQQASTTQKVQLAQSSAQQHSAQVNANIATALDTLTASPIMVALLLAGIAYMIFFRKRG